MNKTRTMKPWMLCLAGALALTPLGVMGESAPKPAAPAAGSTVPVQVDPDLPPIEIPPEILEQLNGMAEESSKAMGEANKLLADNIESIKNAEAIFDRMIETIRAAAANGAPDSQFVASIEDLARMARTDSAEAEQLGNMAQAVEWLATQAENFEEAKGQAIEIYTSSFQKIRDIEKEKKRFVLAIKVKQYQLARKNVDAGLKILRSLDDQIGAVWSKLPAPEAEPQ